MYCNRVVFRCDAYNYQHRHPETYQKRTKNIKLVKSENFVALLSNQVSIDIMGDGYHNKRVDTDLRKAYPVKDVKLSVSNTVSLIARTI